jgi:hypothetical protein
MWSLKMLLKKSVTRNGGACFGGSSGLQATETTTEKKRALTLGFHSSPQEHWRFAQNARG